MPFPEPLICPERDSFDLHLPSLLVGIYRAVCVVIYRASLRRLSWIAALALATNCFSDCMEHRVLLLEDEVSDLLEAAAA